MTEQAQELEEVVLDLDNLDQPEEQAAPEYTEAEQRAMEMGWNPDPESLKETGKEWIPAEEFLRNQTFFSEIKKLKKEIKQSAKVTEALREHNKIIYDRAYANAYETLKKQKVAAAQDRDLERMLEIDDQIDSLNKNKQQLEEETAQVYSKTDWDTAFEDFVEQNSWYNEDEVKRTYADKIGWDYATSKKGVSPEEVYEYVIKTVQEKFKQQAPQRRAAPVATPSRSGSRNTSGKTMADVPEEHRRLAQVLIKSGELSEADYLKQYFAE